MSSRQSEGPHRPAIAPAVWFAAAVWVGSAVAEESSWRAWTSVPLPWLPAAAAAVGAVALAACGVRAGVRHARRGSTSILVLLALGLTFGVGLSTMHGVRWAQRVADVGAAGACEVTGRVLADSRDTRFGVTVRIGVTRGPLRGIRLRVGLPEGAGVPELGQMITFSLVPKALGSEDTDRRSARGGLHGTGNAYLTDDVRWARDALSHLYRWRAHAGTRLRGVTGDAGALLRGLVLGDRRALLGAAVDEDFRVLGLSHVVAVSGSHLAVICAVVLVLGSRMRASRVLVLVGVLAVATAFTILSGMALAAVRSCVMLVAGAVFEVAGVRRDGIAGLAISAIAIVTVSPWSVFDVGFALSVLAVGGLLVFGSLGVAWARAALPTRAGKVAELLGATLVAQVATLPVVTATFGMLSVAAPLANLCIVPPAEAALCVGLAGAAVGDVVPWVGDVGVSAAGVLLGAVVRAAAVLASLPGAAVSMGSPGAPVLGGLAVATALLWVRWPLPRDAGAARLALSACLICLLAVAVGPRASSGCEVIVMDVGQGDAILIRQGPDAVLVDTGADPTTLRRALARQGVREIDGVVLTHDHDDHTAGLEGLIGVVRVGWVGISVAGAGGYANARNTVPRLTPRGKVGFVEMEAGDSLVVGVAQVRVLWPPGIERSGHRGAALPLSTNDISIVLEVDVGDTQVVLAGDCEEAAQAGMNEAGALHPIEVLKLPHHGSENGLTAAAASVWRPRLGVISVGADNGFGHPSPSTLELLASIGTRVVRTDLDGDVTVAVGHDGARFTTPRATRRTHACATIRRAGARRSSGAAESLQERGGWSRGGFASVGPQTGPPHSRKGRAAARARPPPLAQACGRRGLGRGP